MQFHSVLVLLSGRRVDVPITKPLGGRRRLAWRGMNMAVAELLGRRRRLTRCRVDVPITKPLGGRCRLSRRGMNIAVAKPLGRRRRLPRRRVDITIAELLGRRRRLTRCRVDVAVANPLGGRRLCPNRARYGEKAQGDYSFCCVSHRTELHVLNRRQNGSACTQIEDTFFLIMK